MTMLARLQDTAAPIEIVWCLISGIALAAHIWGAWDSVVDLRGLRRQGVNGLLSFTARGNIGVSGILTLAQGCFLLIGLRALGLPSPTPSGDPSPDAIVNILLLMGGELLMMTVSLFIVYFRRELRRRAREEALRDRIIGQ